MPPSSLSTRLTLLALLSATTFYFLYKSRRRLKTLKELPLNPAPGKGKLFFITQTGTSKALAQSLLNLLSSNNIPFDLVDPQNYEPEDLPKESLILIIASTWEDGNPPENSKFFVNWLAEISTDFRAGSLLLSNCKFAVFGVGSRAYGKTFNAVARDLGKRLRGLGATEMVAAGEGDVDGGALESVFEEWSEKVVRVLKGGLVMENENGIVYESDAESLESDDDDDDGGGGEEEIVDLEDIAGRGPSRKKSVNVAETNGKLDGKREMVTPVIRANLEKQVIWFKWI